MDQIINGANAAIALVITGQSATALNGDDLAVDLLTDLSVDARIDLAVVAPVTWKGTTALQLLPSIQGFCAPSATPSK